MSREIKFRAWQTSNEWPGRMLHDVTPLWDGEVLCEASTNNGRIDGVVVAVECVEQYTGLKDSNGKEIYEGDVIRAVEKTCCISIGDVETVEWEPRLFGWHPFAEVNNVEEREFQPSGFEVIGNIHQGNQHPKEGKEGGNGD